MGIARAEDAELGAGRASPPTVPGCAPVAVVVWMDIAAAVQC